MRAAPSGPDRLADAGETKRWDVIVIGAGMAGLAAATTLSDAGHRVLILEARQRVGGRIHTVQPPGWERPVDLGAEFIHGPHAELETLCENASGAPTSVEDLHWWCEEGRLRPAADFWGRANEALKQIGPAFGGSFGDWMTARGGELTAAVRADLRNVVTGFHAADPARMSARTLFISAHEEEEQQRPPSGYGPLVRRLQEGLASGVELRLNSPVTRIEWRPGEATVVSGAAAARWRARRVVITVPLAVLQAPADAAGAIEFCPAVPERARGWRTLGVGHVQRILLRFGPTFWQEPLLPAALREQEGRRFGFVHTREPAFPVWWALAPDPILVGWWGGPEAEAVAGAADDDLRLRAVQSLARALGVEFATLERQLVDWRSHNWSRDIYARGAYSFATAGAEDLPVTLAAPIAHTLFFAGEAFAGPLVAGTVQGALESGQRAGRAVIASLRARHSPQPVA